MIRLSLPFACLLASDVGVVGLPADSSLPAQRAPASADTVVLKEWDVPWGSATRPRDPAVGADGRIWFVGQEGNYVARLDPASGKCTRIKIDPGTNPHSINVDRAGDAWYTGNRNSMIGRIDVATGAITRFRMPDSAAKDPHTIPFDAKGDLWFTLQNSNMLGHLDHLSGKVRLVKMAKPGSRFDARDGIPLA